MNLLVVEDDEKIARYLLKGLREAGYTVDHLSNAEEALGAATLQRFDALIVDLMLPGRDGLWLIESARSRGLTTPILILSAKRTVDDRVQALRAGGDDYLTKPFSFSELVVRVEALIRRATMHEGGGTARDPLQLRYADVELDIRTRRVRRDGTLIDLQPREFSLLEFFMRHPGQVLTKTMILEHVWNYNFDPQTNVVDVLVSRLRAKLDRDFETKLIHTVRGVGYVLRLEEPA